jgi:aryl-alcohol dehydrogenase-like predicted oxidoreductase
MEYRRPGNTGVKVSRICAETGVRGPFDASRLTEVTAPAVDLGCDFL